jgi:site-specific recombinase XerD
MYLPGQRGLSQNTIMAYRDTFKLLLLFAEEEKRLKLEKFSFADFNAGFVSEFLDWPEEKRGCGVSTRNQRLAALRAFAKYARTHCPEFLDEAQRIMGMKAKKTSPPAMEYLSAEQLKSVLAQPDISTKDGRRDMVLLSLLYDSGARVQEICDLRVRDIRLQKPYTVTLTGKGNKVRFVPIMKATVDALATYLKENRLQVPEKADSPLFRNHQRGKLTRAGVAYILKKHFESARKDDPSLPAKISPHILRHSKAMHLLQAGVNLIYIRDFLGHVHVETTEIYARADTEAKRTAIERVQIQTDADLPEWTDDRSLMAMLTGLCGGD